MSDIDFDTPPKPPTWRRYLIGGVIVVGITFAMVFATVPEVRAVFGFGVEAPAASDR